MSRLADQLAGMRASGRKALVPFLTAGYPDMPGFLKVLEAASKSGADVIEVGLPFSDPLADGPAIQLSSCQALAAGYSLAALFGELQAITPALPQPLVAMTYVNPVLSYGATRFAADAATAGFSAAIFPDLPLGEEAGIASALAAAGLDMIRLVAPSTGAERLTRLTAKATGFIYLVSVSGVTGERTGLRPDLGTLVQRVRGATGLPILIGFGISTPEQATAAAVHGDGVIVGSVLMRLIAEAGDAEQAVTSVSRLLREMRSALDGLETKGAQR